VVNPTANINSAVTMATNVEFADEDRGLIYDERNDHVLNDRPVSNTSLSDFLSRPVRVFTGTWSETTAASSWQNLNVWNLFFNNQYIKYKINNYAFLRCKLHVKITVNASPFYYGAMLASYSPLDQWDARNVGNVTTEPIVRSQRPHVWIFPQNGTGGELELPFLSPRDWLRVSVAADFTKMGTLNLFIVDQLDNAIGVGGDATTGVSVQVFAWATDVEVSGATTPLALQSGRVKDEYGKGPISAPASAVANIAGKLEKAPVIGPLATATRVGAKAVSDIASLFGFSTVPNIDAVDGLAPRAFPHMANVGIPYPREKLSLDPKNEISVNPQDVGDHSEDNLNIAELAGRESYMSTFQWLTTDGVDTTLYSTRVTPMMFSNAAVAGGTVAAVAPMGWVAAMFRYWRGDIIFRFRIIASQYHKGRLRISWDPTGLAGDNMATNPNTIPLIQTKIVDIGKSSDIEIRIPYQQATQWLAVKAAYEDAPFTSGNRPWVNGPAYDYRPGNDNGYLQVRVANVLSSPNEKPTAANGVRILVSVRAADNIEFANPDLPETNGYYFAPQSGLFDELEMGEQTAPRATGLLYTGEEVKSIRTLLQRMSLVDIIESQGTNIPDPTVANATHAIYQATFTAIPELPGYDPFGKDSARNQANSTNVDYNFSMHTNLAWIYPAFVGWRGSINYTFNGNLDGKALTSMRVVRGNFGNVGQELWYTTTETARSKVRSFYKNVMNSGNAGSALCNQMTNAGLSVSAPWYRPVKFALCDPNVLDYTDKDDFTGDTNLRLEIAFPPKSDSNSNRTFVIHRYVSVGPDFNPVFFVNVPPVYYYATDPPIPS